MLRLIKRRRTTSMIGTGRPAATARSYVPRRIMAGARPRVASAAHLINQPDPNVARRNPATMAQCSSRRFGGDADAGAPCLPAARLIYRPGSAPRPAGYTVAYVWYAGHVFSGRPVRIDLSIPAPARCAPPAARPVRTCAQEIALALHHLLMHLLPDRPGRARWATLLCFALLCLQHQLSLSLAAWP